MPMMKKKIHECNLVVVNGKSKTVIGIMFWTLFFIFQTKKHKKGGGDTLLGMVFSFSFLK